MRKQSVGRRPFTKYFTIINKRWMIIYGIGQKITTAPPMCQDEMSIHVVCSLAKGLCLPLLPQSLCYIFTNESRIVTTLFKTNFFSLESQSIQKKSILSNWKLSISSNLGRLFSRCHYIRIYSDSGLNNSF